MNFKKLYNWLFSRNKFRIQTFTYYIPAPPARSTGYREKQFDKTFYYFINKGYEIISLTTQANSGAESSGMWVICTVRALNEEADLLDLETEFEELSSLPQHETKSEPIEGLYYMDS